jgi:hypothetical protein
VGYASNTSVSPEKSQAEIQQVLRRYGAGRFGVMEDHEKAYVMFEFRGLTIQMDVALPNRTDNKYHLTPTGRTRSDTQQIQEYEQDVRQKWRALLLAIKAKLEAVESGISTIEKEFLAFVVMPDGKLLFDHIQPALSDMVQTKKMPKLLGEW